jgi:hypothetical protein
VGGKQRSREAQGAHESGRDAAAEAERLDTKSAEVTRVSDGCRMGRGGDDAARK